MPEKKGPAARSKGLPQMDALPDAAGGGSLFPQAHAAALVAMQANSQESLIVEQAYFEQIIETAPEAISIIDTEKRVLRANGEFTRLFGFSPAEVAGRPIDDLIV